MSFACITDKQEATACWERVFLPFARENRQFVDTRHPAVWLHPFADPAYGSLTSGFRVAVWDAPDLKIWYPVVIQPLSDYPLMPRRIAEQYFDIQHPYGVGGPLIWGGGDVSSFWRAWQGYCRNARIVAELGRFNPVLNNHGPWQQVMNVFTVKDTYVMDLSLEDPLAQISKNLRRDYQQGMKKGLTASLDASYDDNPEKSYWPAFIDLYNQTMDHKQADPMYYWDSGYFARLAHWMQDGHGTMVNIVREDQYLSGALFLHRAGIAYYHLSGSTAAGKSLGASVFAIVTGAMAAREKNCHTLFLGGGLVAGDSLEQFKRRFTQQSPLPYRIGTAIHLPEVYQAIRDAWSEPIKNRVLFWR